METMKTDKFLLGIIIGIIILVIAAVAVVMTRTRSEQYVADDNPAGVVHNYYLAIQREEYQKAYTYLSDDIPGKPSLDEFITTIDSNRTYDNSTLSIDSTTTANNRARVKVTITTFSGGGLFDRGSYSRPEVVQLQLENNQWKILQFPYPYWGYNWDQKQD